MEITSQTGGPAEKKPAYYIDAMTHAEELAGSVVALYTAWYLLSQYGAAPMVTRLLDSQTFYILPMLNPDGAEVVLTRPFYEWIGNGRYLPGEEQLEEGLQYADLDGDGTIVDMRVRDENGEWKISGKDPRLMIPRQPFEYGGEYYRVFPEGFIEGFDGAQFEIPQPQDGNLNRNFPYGWGPEGEEYGAGQYPMSEPEIEAAVKFVLAHPNICSAINYHTNAGILLRPLRIEGGPIPLEDDAAYARIGEMGTEETGYRQLKAGDVFNFPGRKPRMGTATAFLYGQLGVMNFVTELWDVFDAAGIEKDWVFPLRELSEEDKLKLLRWSDEQLDGEGFKPWKPFDHPQLGPVEIGGWKRLFMFRNPPGQHLEQMCRKNAMFSIKHAATAPRIKVTDVSISALAEDVFKLEAVVENQGYLPTNVTQRAITQKTAEPVVVTLKVGEGIELASGKERVELGHLTGRAERKMKYSRFIDWHASRKKVEWVVQLRGIDSGEVYIHAGCPRAGEDAERVVVSRSL